MTTESATQAEPGRREGGPSAAADPAVFALDRVSFSYPLRGGELAEVLREVSVSLRRGEIGAVVGPSGSGKSTLLAVAAGLRQPTAGRVLVGGVDATGLPGRVGFMMQRDELLPWRSVLENVVLGPEITRSMRRRAAERRARELLELAGLRGYEQHYPAALSGGMRQRVAFLRTLMLERETVLLDEPFGALDAITRADMQEWLLRLVAEFELTLLLVTHDVDEAIFMSDRMLALTGAPGTITMELDVPFPRPRDYEAVVADAHFGELKSAALHAIRAGRA